MRNRDARIAGFLYLLFALSGFFGLMYAPNALIKPGDAVATAHNLATHESLARLWIISDIVGIMIGLAVVFALYRLFKDVDPTQTILLVILGGIMPVPLYLINAANIAAALLLAHGGAYLNAFSEPQRAALAMVFLRLHHYDLMTSFVFAGLWLFPFGILVYKSGFLP